MRSGNRHIGYAVYPCGNRHGRHRWQLEYRSLHWPHLSLFSLFYLPHREWTRRGAPAPSISTWSLSASLLAAGTCAVLVISARSIRETRILFLALSFFSLAMIFAVHGLATPGHLIDHPSAAIMRSPWLATMAAGFFATLSVLTIPRVVERSRLRLPEIIFIVCAGMVVAYFGVSLASPNWLAGFPTQREWFQHLLSAVTIGLLCFAAWRYFDSYVFTRLTSQLAVMSALLFLAEAQLSMDFGRFFRFSWWMYHGLFLVAFLSILATGRPSLFGPGTHPRSPRLSPCVMP